MNILITGASGFVGSNLINLFKKNKKINLVCVSTREKSEIINKNIRWIKINKFDEEVNWSDIIKNIDVIIHLAGVAHSNLKENDEKILKLNFLATKNFAKESINSGIKKFIFISTVKVNGEYSLPDQRFNTKYQVNPRNIYSKYKYLNEVLLRDLFKEKKISLAIIRSPLIYGPGVKANFRLLQKFINYSIPVPFGSFNNIRSFVSIENLFGLIQNIIFQKKYIYDTYYVSDDDDISTNELLDRIANSKNKKICIISIPKILVKFFLLITFQNSKIEKMYSNSLVDITYTKQNLSWKPNVSMNDTLKKMN